jgi:hypothetical protein
VLHREYVFCALALGMDKPVHWVPSCLTWRLGAGGAILCHESGCPVLFTAHLLERADCVEMLILAHTHTAMHVSRQNMSPHAASVSARALWTGEEQVQFRKAARGRVNKPPIAASRRLLKVTSQA